MGGGTDNLKVQSSAPVSPTAGLLWVDTDNNKIYRRNDANSAWITNVDSANQLIDEDLIVTPYNQTIGDYTQPSGATASSAATTGDSPTYEDDFTGGASGWSFTTGGSGQVAQYNSNQLEFTMKRSTSYNGVIYDLGSGAVSDTKWVIRFKYRITTAGGGHARSYYFGLRSDNSLQEQPSGNDVIGFRPMPQDSRLYIYVRNNGTDGSAYQSGVSLSTSTDYYVEIIRVSASEAKFNIYTNSSYTGTPAFTHTDSSDVSGITDLRYFAIYNVNGSSSGAAAASFDFDDFEFFNDTNSVIPTVTHTAALAIDDDTSTRWQSNAETNPNIYVDMGANANLTHVALYPTTSYTTETEFTVQTSQSAGSGYTTKRTIDFSNLTNDAWNFIRFPSTIARYVKIYGSSGESKVLSFEEIKVLKETDSQLVTSHGHENISTTSTTTGLDGS
jgi:hypothetical protein